MSAMVTDHEVDKGTRPAPAGQPAYFYCRNMQAYYGKSYIVQGVGFEIHEGEIWLDHQPLHEMSAYQASRLGVGLFGQDSRPCT